ncbi:MAG: DUF3592 domain-containing protein [Acidiferrobacterales bacterium]
MKTRRKHRPSIALLIFGLIFAGIGVGIGIFGPGASLVEWADRQDWQPVNAIVLSAELRQHRGDKGSISYEAATVYRYQYRGRSYTGDRVGISTGSDNVGDWHQNWYARLRTAMRVGTPITVWIDPDDPSRSIIDRELRWGKLGFLLVFVAVFGGAGAFIIWLALRRPAAKSPAPAGQPWLANPAWRNGQVRSSAHAVLWASWGIALFWNAVSAPALLALPREMGHGNYPALLVLLFPLVGIGMIVFALRKTLEWRRFGPVVLTLEPFPGVTGGNVGGYLELRLPYRPEYKFAVTLTCSHVRRRRSGNRNRTFESVVWQDEQLARVEPGLRGARARFSFRVPPDQPQSEEPSDSYHKWAVHVRAALPGINLDRMFVVPVYRTPRSAAVGQATAAAAEQAPITVPATAVHISHAAGATRFYYPLFRQLGAGIGLLLVGTIFAGATAYMIYEVSSARGFHAVLTMMVLVFGATSVAIVLGALYVLGNSLTVDVSARGVTVTRRVFGVPFQRHIGLNDVRTIDTQLGMQTSSGSTTTAYYTVKLVLKDGKKVTIGDNLKGASVADSLKRRISDATGLRADHDAPQPHMTRPALKDLPADEKAKRVARSMRIAAAVLGLTFTAAFFFEFWEFFSDFLN